MLFQGGTKKLNATVEIETFECMKLPVIEAHAVFVVEENQSSVEGTMICRRQCYSIRYMISTSRSANRKDIHCTIAPKGRFITAQALGLGRESPVFHRLSPERVNHQNS